MQTDEDVQPFDFLFCENCDKHVGMNYKFDFEMDKMTESDRTKRMCPIVRWRAICEVCKGPLCQKYITVTVNIKVDP